MLSEGINFPPFLFAFTIMNILSMRMIASLIFDVDTLLKTGFITKNENKSLIGCLNK